jgi:hypothetical protein
LLVSVHASGLGIAGYALLNVSYFGNPRTPDPASGYIIPHEVKHVIVYITEREDKAINLVFWFMIFSVAVLLISLVINQRWPLPPTRWSK